MKADGPPVQNLINRIFRCRHRRKTIPFTPRGEEQCYAVCLDCGQRIVGANPVFASASYPRPATPAPTRVVETGPRDIAAAKPAPPPGSSNQNGLNGAASASKARRKARQKVREPQTPARVAEEAKGPRPVFSLRDGRYNLLWVALFGVGLSGGLYFSGSAKPQHPLPAPLAPPALRSAPVAESSRSILSAPATSPKTEPVAAKPAAGNAAPTPRASADVALKRRLDGKNSLVILGLDAPAVQELTRHPRRLPELVQSGSLFTVPRGTAVEVQEDGEGVLKVRLLDGSMAGREGWVTTSQVTPRYRSGEPNRLASQ